MLSRAQIKYINALKLKKHRQNYGQFVAEGDKIVQSLIRSGYKVLNIYAVAGWLDENISNHPSIAERTQVIKEQELQRISSLKSPNQVLAIAEIPKHEITPAELENDWVLVLDEIRDPGNLGTIIRTADWFGFKHIVCSETSADIWNPKVVQSTMGSLFHVDLVYKDVISLFKQYPERKVFGALLSGSEIDKNSFAEKGFLVLGNEARGIRKEVVECITNGIKIPGFGKAESLNVGVAGGILMAMIKIGE